MYHAKKSPMTILKTRPSLQTHKNNSDPGLRLISCYIFTTSYMGMSQFTDCFNCCLISANYIYIWKDTPPIGQSLKCESNEIKRLWAICNNLHIRWFLCNEVFNQCLLLLTALPHLLHHLVSLATKQNRSKKEKHYACTMLQLTLLLSTQEVLC
jgi:hypothetical protein